MDTSRALSLVEQLDDNIEDLEDVLKPLLNQALSETNKKLPVLDRAKLHVTIVYAIESLLFSYLRLNGVEAKDHPVFRELARVKQYFEKIKEAENGGPLQNQPSTREMTLDKQAALRMIKHSLAGNKKIDLERAEAEARQKLLAKRKLKALEASMKEKAENNDTTMTDVDVSAEVTEQEIAEIVASAAVDVIASPAQADDSMSPSGAQDPPPANSEQDQEQEPKKKTKKNKKRRSEDVNGGDVVDQGANKRTKGEKRKAKKERKREREAAAASAATEVVTTPAAPGLPE